MFHADAAKPLTPRALGGGNLSRLVIAVRGIGRDRLNAHYLPQVGSTLVTNGTQAGPQELPQRHQMDYTICCAELQSVDLTAAPTADSFQQEVGATDCRKKTAKLTSV